MLQSIKHLGQLYTFSNPLIMGILNITQNSFYDGGKYLTIDKALAHTEKMIEEGANIIDVGAMSSRPFSEPIDLEIEKDRIRSIMPILCKKYPDTIFSIDTYRSQVAEIALDSGASILNDISGFELDNNLLNIAAKYRCAYILMHIKGTPATMQFNTDYKDILGDIYSYFTYKLATLKKAGLTDIILDVGFGFGKTVDQNYKLLNELNYFNTLNLPQLVGLSRKSMIYKPLNISAAEALSSTQALHMAALERGAKILRVHDVKAAKETIALYELLSGKTGG